jgi:antitoxin component of RelBE/YafQ-DinJ toxin-antitoxin module
MPNTLTSLSIDKKIKEKAEKKAKELSLTLSGVTRILLNDFAEGKIRIGTIIVERDENGFSKFDQQELDKALIDTKNNKNLEGPFFSSEEFTKKPSESSSLSPRQ